MRTVNGVTLAAAITALLAGWAGPSRAADSSTGLSGGTPLKVQSKARPFGLDIVAPALMSASDAASASFTASVLPGIQSLVTNTLGESRAVKDVSGMMIDPSKLKLRTDAEVRVYFVGEGAGYHNTLGFNPLGGKIEAEAAQLIFPDTSTNDAYYLPDLKKKELRTASTPLLPGDFVNLGSFTTGTLLDFFLIADGANGGKYSFGMDASANPDGLVHVVALSLPNSPYLILGFEDMRGGGDRDYNDLVIAVDVGKSNVKALSGGAEPCTTAILATFLGAGWLVGRKRGRARRSES